MCFLISCIYAHTLCILAYCFNGVSLRLLSATSISYLIVLWSADRTVYLLIEPETGDRLCDRRCNVRLRVLRQNQRRVAQRAETILVLLVLGLIWLVARSTAEPLSSRSRERFAVSLATHSYSHKRKQLTSNKLAFSSGAKCNARLYEAMLIRANGALRDVERLTRLG